MIALSPQKSVILSGCGRLRALHTTKGHSENRVFVTNINSRIQPIDNALQHISVITSRWRYMQGDFIIKTASRFTWKGNAVTGARCTAQAMVIISDVIAHTFLIAATIDGDTKPDNSSGILAHANFPLAALKPNST
ncbi:MAG: hypothetical protein RDA78_15905 [Roseibium sp.]|uniref:hypothetical protein n=1 Tax=Roseibium sp. TaxID=1936156 RepID=UPI003D9C0E7A